MLIYAAQTSQLYYLETLKVQNKVYVHIVPWKVHSYILNVYARLLSNRTTVNDQTTVTIGPPSYTAISYHLYLFIFAITPSS